MADFWAELFACENRGHAYIRNNPWHVASYDAKLAPDLDNHCLDVDATARGVIIEDCHELRFLLGLNVRKPDRSACVMDRILLDGAPCAVVRDGFLFALQPGKRLVRGIEIELHFRYRVEPLARKCWVNSEANGVIPGLGQGETELCFEGFWLPFANDRFQAVDATLHIQCPDGLSVIANANPIPSSEAQLGGMRSYRMPMPGFPVIVIGQFASPTCSDGVTFYHQDGYANVAQLVVEQAGQIRALLSRWLLHDPGGSMSLVQLRRTSFGQYAPFPAILFERDDITVDGKSLDMTQLNSMLGHEISHFWFGGLLRDSLEEQWLSEGFAQYLSLCIIEELHGAQARDRELQAYLAALAETDWRGHPPLCAIPLDHRNQPLLVRAKAALVLHLLRQEIGLASMRSLLAALVRTRAGTAISTSVIEEEWSEMVEGSTIHEFFGEHVRSASILAWDSASGRVVAARQ